MEVPFIDEHRELVPAPAEEVWPALVATVTHGLAAPAPLAAVLGTSPRHATVGVLATGSTIVGFAAAEVVPPRLIRLAGRHRFSRYELVFTLEPASGGTVLAARSSAEFPGPHGFLYRTLVITSGAHRLLVTRLLRTIARRASTP
ncbi:hypothetical protein [Kutzneria sp. CA-103260]|uniref:hypothetical protein n=1 Tax=Kutzneria sp. CA-103260 TaxID=2802641 RepID=UPI001BACD520|nr:hypothetical protein [Kutzneria sp. CA-103260]QUQ66225.1 hypothetical protein JJ691_39520 [Kutzneria sp. CA-103260]